MLFDRLTRPAARVSLSSPVALTLVPILLCTAALGQDAGTNGTESTTSSPSTAAPTSTTESSRTTASSSPDGSSFSFDRSSVISFVIGLGLLFIVLCLLPRRRRRRRRRNPAVQTQTSPLTPPAPSYLAAVGAPSRPGAAVPPPPPLPPFAVSNSQPVAMRVLTPAGPGVVYAIPVPPPPPSTLGMHAAPAPLPAAAFPPLPHQHHHHHQRRRPRFDVSTLNSFEVAEDSRDDACPICLGPLHEEKVSVGPCLHIAHTSCLKQWLTKDADSTCPVCRVSFAAGNDAGAGDGEDSSGANSSALNGVVGGVGPGQGSPALVPLPPLPPLPPSLHARNSFPHAFHSRLAAPPPVGAPVSQQEQPLSLPPPPVEVAHAPTEAAHAPTEAAQQQEQRHQSSDQSVDVATASYPQTTNPVLPHEAPSGREAQGALQQQQQQEIQLPPPPPPPV